MQRHGASSIVCVFQPRLHRRQRRPQSLCPRASLHCAPKASTRYHCAAVRSAQPWTKPFSWHPCLRCKSPSESARLHPPAPALPRNTTALTNTLPPVIMSNHANALLG